MKRAFRPLKALWMACLVLGALGVFALSIAACFGLESHKLELLSNLRLPLLVASAIVFLLLLAARARWMALLPLACVLGNGIVVAPLFIPEAPRVARTDKVTIATINI